MRVPSNFKNCAKKLCNAGQAGPETNVPSVIALSIGKSTNVPFASVTSTLVPGYALHFFPSNAPAAASNCAP